MAYTKRDSKDPIPTADNTARVGESGNVAVTGEKHDQAKGSTVGADANRSTGPVADAVAQPTRQDGDGNVPATGELHGQKKAQQVTESQRW